MSTTTIETAIEEDEQRLDLFGIEWDQYVTINDAFPERRGLRMLYLDGSLTFLTLSRRHDWHVEYLDKIIVAVACGCGIDMDLAGSSTLRAEDLKAGVEGDQIYYFGPNAEIMHGPVNIDLSVQPPPDLAIEVELSHSANQVMAIYARLGVLEVWRLDPKRGTLSFLVLGEDGAYRPATHSRNLPLLKPEDVSVQLKLVEEIRVVHPLVCPAQRMGPDDDPASGRRGLRAMDDWSSPENWDLSEELFQFVKPELEPGERLLWAATEQARPPECGRAPGRFLRRGRIRRLELALPVPVLLRPAAAVQIPDPKGPLIVMTTVGAISA